jgi:hypothetical protein
LGTLQAVFTSHPGLALLLQRISSPLEYSTPFLEFFGAISPEPVGVTDVGTVAYGLESTDNQYVGYGSLYAL